MNKLWRISASALSKALNGEVVEDFASISGIEFFHIDQDSTVSEERKELRNNEVY